MFFTCTCLPHLVHDQVLCFTVVFLLTKPEYKRAKPWIWMPTPGFVHRMIKQFFRLKFCTCSIFLRSVKCQLYLGQILYVEWRAIRNPTRLDRTICYRCYRLVKRYVVLLNVNFFLGHIRFYFDYIL